jgi:predicted nucleotidyltransferase component of viral defense system
MKEEALAVARERTDPVQRLNVLREYLQVCILRSLHESEGFLQLSFVGGTALRFLYKLPRFSEDLDFSLENQNGYAPLKWLKKLSADLSLMGFQPTLSWNDRKIVHVAWIRVAELLKEAGLATLGEQKVSIKLEIDTRPPLGADMLTEIVTRHFLFTVRHHDLPSLMAGKIHALCTRSYSKGRDWYDLLWYRSQRPAVEPNLVLLQNALDQTQRSGTLEAGCWPQYAWRRLESFDAAKLADDVRPFLERPRDADAITLDNLRSVLWSAK